MVFIFCHLMVCSTTTAPAPIITTATEEQWFSAFETAGFFPAVFYLNVLTIIKK